MWSAYVIASAEVKCIVTKHTKGIKYRCTANQVGLQSDGPALIDFCISPSVVVASVSSDLDLSDLSALARPALQ